MFVRFLDPSWQARDRYLDVRIRFDARPAFDEAENGKDILPLDIIKFMKIGLRGG